MPPQQNWERLGLWALTRDIPLIYISGGISYYDPHATNISEDAELGWSGLGGCYGLSKLLGEDALKRLRKRGLKLAILRASSIYGAGMKSNKVISRFIENAVNDIEIELFQKLFQDANQHLILNIEETIFVPNDSMNVHEH